MKNARVLLITAGAVMASVAPLLVFARQQAANAKVVRVTGTTVVARDTATGRTFAFIVPADVAGSLRDGDAATVDFGSMKLVSLKGTSRTAAVQQPDSSAPCCAVVAYAKDGPALHALLNSVSGYSANSAMIDLKTLVSGGRVASSAVDAAAPVTGVLLLRDLKSEAQHIVLISGTPPQGVLGSMLSAVGVSVDESAGIALFKSGVDSYSFPLWRLNGPGNGPWEITEDKTLQGIYGKLSTHFPAGTDNTGRQVTLMSPGTTTRVSYQGTGSDHQVPEGAYDVDIEKVVLRNVPIQKGHVTRVFVGAIAFANKDRTLHHIFDAKGENELFSMLGTATIGMPAGSYSLKAGTRAIPFEIKDGEVTTL